MTVAEKMYGVRFGKNDRSPIMGRFSSPQRAAWWAQQECDGQAYRVYDVTPQAQA